MQHWWTQHREWSALLAHCKACTTKRCGCKKFVESFGSWASEFTVDQEDPAHKNDSHETWLWFSLEPRGEFHWQCVVCHHGDDLPPSSWVQKSILAKHQTSHMHARNLQKQLHIGSGCGPGVPSTDDFIKFFASLDVTKGSFGSLYIGGNWSTLAHVKHSTFATLSGSTKRDVIGPVDLDDPADLAMIHHSKVKEYYGKRYILAGGN